MKFDKETLIKQRFWVLMGVYVPLVVIVLAWLWTYVDSEVSADGKITKDKQTQLGQLASGQLEGRQELDVLKKKVAELTLLQDEKWQQAWALQEDINPEDRKLKKWTPTRDALIFWPESPSNLVERTYIDLNFGDRLPEGLIGVRNDYASPQVYPQQVEALGRTFDEILPFKSVDPKDPKKERDTTIIQPVQFNGGWEKVLTYVKDSKNDIKWVARPPEDDEVWLAQEDLWVQRELLRSLKEANAMVARFQPFYVGKDVKADKAMKREFTNPYWKIDLELVKDKQFVVRGKITNIGKHRQTLGKTWFRLYVHTDPSRQPVVIPLEAPNLGVAESFEIKDTPLNALLNPTGLYGLEQVLEPNTAPVRRIDQIALYHHSHRTAEPALQPPEFMRAAATTPRPADPKKGPGPVPPPAPGPLPGPGAATMVGLTKNGIQTLRYTDVTPQVRRMPLAMVLVVDQAHVPEVLTALANSKLRMQITQMSWQHFRGTITPHTAEGPDKKLDAGGPGHDPKLEGQDQASNLVELVVYGIASLYERPRDKLTGAPTPPKKDFKDKKDKTDTKDTKDKKETAPPAKEPVDAPKKTE